MTAMRRVMPIVYVVVGAFSSMEMGVALAGSPTRDKMVLLAFSALALWLLRESFVAFRELPEEPPKAPTVEQIVAAQVAEEAAHGFSCAPFEVPRLVGPLEEFEEILARHEAILRAHLLGLNLLARQKLKWKTPVRIDRHAGEIDARGPSAPRIAFRGRFETARNFADMASIAHRVADFPGRERTHVVVIDDDAASVRRLELRTEKLPSGRTLRRLVLAGDEVTYEPVRQSVSRSGAEWTRRWRATASSPIHEERFTLRPPAATAEECLDRLFLASGHKLREWIAYAREMGRPLDQAICWCGPGKRFGPYAHAMTYDRAHIENDPFEHWPRSELALRHPWPAGWIPVLVTRAPFGGIRWMRIDPAVDERTRPDDVTEWVAGGTHPV